MSELLVQFIAEPPEEVFVAARNGRERLAVAQRFYAALKSKLRAEVMVHGVEITDLDATGAMLLHGTTDALAEIARPGGTLERNAVVVAGDAEFLPMARSS